MVAKDDWLDARDLGLVAGDWSYVEYQLLNVELGLLIAKG